MKLSSQSGVTTLQIIIILTILAVVAAVIGMVLPKTEEAATQVSTQTAVTDTPIETFAKKQAEDIAAPVNQAVSQKSKEIKAQMEDEVEVEMESKPATAIPTSAAVPNPEPAPLQGAGVGTFTDYSPAALSADSTNVLFFHADWCPTCRGLENNLNANLSDIPANVNILKLDYDTETELKKKYGVIRQHTLIVVDADGNEIKKLTGLTNTLDQVVSQL